MWPSFYNQEPDYFDQEVRYDHDHANFRYFWAEDEYREQLKMMRFRIIQYFNPKGIFRTPEFFELNIPRFVWHYFPNYYLFIDGEKELYKYCKCETCWKYVGMNYFVRRTNKKIAGVVNGYCKVNDCATKPDNVCPKYGFKTFFSQLLIQKFYKFMINPENNYSIEQAKWELQTQEYIWNNKYKKPKHLPNKEEDY